jgi:colicin import membrane protein
MKTRLASLWNVKSNVERPGELKVTVRIRLGRDGRLSEPPQVVSTGNSARYQAAANAAVQAVIQGQPYTMLRDESYEEWKYMDIDFDPTQMFVGR